MWFAARWVIVTLMLPQHISIICGVFSTRLASATVESVNVCELPIVLQQFCEYIWLNFNAFRFPVQRPGILKLWLHNLRRENFVPSSTSYVCGYHFLPECFVSPSGSGRQCLKVDAVPTGK